MVMSSWHKGWIHRTDQLTDLCRSHHLIRGEVEGNLFTARQRASTRRRTHSIDMLIENIQWVMHQIEAELPPAREVINLRACGVPWREIAERLPGRALISMREDYTAFLRKVHVHPHWSYLRRRNQ